MPHHTRLVNNRSYTAFLPIDDELDLKPHKNYLFDLSWLGCLDLTGAASQDFLQGQLSCDLKKVTSSQMRSGALCNLKGRLLALLDVIDWHGLHLILPCDLLLKTQNTLNKTAVFSKVKLNQAQDYQIFGLYLQNSDNIVPFNAHLTHERYSVISTDTYCAYHLGLGFYIFIISKSHVDDVCSHFIKEEQMRGSLSWHALRLRQHHIEIYPESRGLFLPHRVGLHLSGYLSFDKGCYKGQEIIARTHYRAKLKHEMKLFMISTTEPLKSGQRLFSPDNHKELGELIDFCPFDQSSYLIAVSMIFDHPMECRIEEHKTCVRLRLQ